MDIVTIDLILWFIVYPLALFGALLAYRALYQKHMRWRREQDTREALERIREEEEAIRAYWARPPGADD